MLKATSTKKAGKSASAPTAVSGGISAKPKSQPAKKRGRPKGQSAPKTPKLTKETPPKSKPLPPPIEVPGLGEPAQPEGASGLLQFPTHQNLQSDTGGRISGMTSLDEPSPEDPLGEEAELLLGQIPESLGVVEDTDSLSADNAAANETIASLMAAIAFEEDDVRETLSELFDWAAEVFQSDHWKLSERQERMLGRPTAQLLNSLWAKLQKKLPDVLAKWMSETPGASAFFLACGIVVVPKAAKQYKLSRNRKPVSALKPPTSHGPAPAKQTEKPKPPANSASVVWARQEE